VQQTLNSCESVRNAGTGTANVAQTSRVDFVTLSRGRSGLAFTAMRLINHSPILCCMSILIRLSMSSRICVSRHPLHGSRKLLKFKNAFITRHKSRLSQHHLHPVTLCKRVVSELHLNTRQSIFQSLSQHLNSVVQMHHPAIAVMDEAHPQFQQPVESRRHL
jgi:hypothetical protein